LEKDEKKKDPTFEDFFDEAIKEETPADDVEFEEEPANPSEKETSEQESTDTEVPQEEDTELFNRTPDDGQASDGEEENPESSDETDYKDLYEKEKQRTSSWEGRIRAANKRAEEAEAKLAEALKAKGETPTLPDGASEEDLEAFFKEYPDLESPFRALARKEAEALVDERLQKITPKIESIEQRSQADDTKAHFDAIAEKHPDFSEIVESGKLEAWINAQPAFLREGLQRVAQSGSASEVIEMFDSYKRVNTPSPQSKPKPKPTPSASRRAQDLLAVPGSSGGPPKDGPAKEDFDAAWEEAVK